MKDSTYLPGPIFPISPPQKDTNPKMCSSESVADLILQISKADAIMFVLISSLLLSCC